MISKKQLTKRLMGLAAPLLTSPLLAAAQLDHQAKPNVVMILSDDQAYHDYGFMGHDQMHTPNLDRLASQSLVFTRGYVTTALCCPSLGSILTGAYPHQHGYTGNDPIKGWDDRQTFIQHFSQFPQLPRLLSENGYLTLHTGKYWRGNPHEVSGFTHSMSSDQHRHGSPKSLQIGRDGLQPIYDFIDKAQSEEKPFMVWYAPFLPHTPHTPPERLLKKNEGRKYHAMVEWFDETCGELLQYLDDQGLSDNTIVMFISDNGWPNGAAWGQYRGIVAKLTPWEQGVRTPIMIRWPGRVNPKMDETSLAYNLDLPVTVLSALGIPVPDTMEGVDLLDEQAVEARECIFLEDFAHNMVAPDKPEETLEARSVICGDWKLVENYIVEQREIPGAYLFNLKEDPTEKHNLAASHPEKLAELRAKLNAWWNPKPDVQVETRADGIATLQCDYHVVNGANLTMKVYWPAGRRPSPDGLPAVLLLHEEGRELEARRQKEERAIQLAKSGHACVLAEYRGAGEKSPPDPLLSDARRVIEFLHQRAEMWNLDPKQIRIESDIAPEQLTELKQLNAQISEPQDQ